MHGYMYLPISRSLTVDTATTNLLQTCTETTVQSILYVESAITWNPALNRSSVWQCFEHSNAVEIHNWKMFYFYLGLHATYPIIGSMSLLTTYFWHLRNTHHSCLHEIHCLLHIVYLLHVSHLWVPNVPRHPHELSIASKSIQINYWISVL